jgi:hypothetical protein
MEKLLHIVSDIFQDAELSQWIWGFIGMVTACWHVFYPFRMSMLNEKQLVEISPNYEGIMNQYKANLALWAFTVLVVIAATPSGWAIKTYGVDFHPRMEISFAFLGILQAFFALSKGVYPQAVSPTFVYGDEKKIRRIALTQIFIAVVVAILSMYAFTYLANALP